VRDARLRQRDEFGGFNWGAAFFGWLVAVGLAAILTGILSAAGAAIGLTEVSESDARDNAETIGIVGGAILVGILMLAYYAGGYVAGRMSRFDGARQGFGVWVFGLLVAIALAVLGAIAGSEYNVLEKLELPRIPIDEGSLTTGGVIALVAVVLGTLIAALAGGKLGERYHRRVDRAAVVD
jgi:amino acid transporter